MCDNSVEPITGADLAEMRVMADKCYSLDKLPALLHKMVDSLEYLVTVMRTLESDVDMLGTELADHVNE